MTLTVRSARPEDAAPAMALVRLSMHGEAEWLFGQEKGHPADEVMSSLYRRKGNRLSHQVCRVAELDGRAAGLLVVYPGSTINRRDGMTGWHLLQIIGLFGTLRVARRMPVYGGLIEARRDEFYISNVAVLPELQGQGIGAKLMAHADELARAAGFRKCSLLVTLDNPARRLYERCGYQVLGTFPIRHPIVANGSGGFYRMVKELS